jgi:hypothetical protein
MNAYFYNHLKNNKRKEISKMDSPKKLNKNNNVSKSGLTAYACYTYCECDKSCYGGSSAGMQVNTIGSSTTRYSN